MVGSFGMADERDALLSALVACSKDLAQYRMAGDWRIYLECLETLNAKIAYVADPLNVHRRHAQSVTHALKAPKHVEEIAAVHAMIRERFKPPKPVLTLQSDYLKEVTAQLEGGRPAEESEVRRCPTRSEKAMLAPGRLGLGPIGVPTPGSSNPASTASNCGLQHV